jgi:hypothetical protein
MRSVIESGSVGSSDPDGPKFYPVVDKVLRILITQLCDDKRRLSRQQTTIERGLSVMYAVSGYRGGIYPGLYLIVISSTCGLILYVGNDH